MNKLGNRIKQLRTEKKMTQENLATILRKDYNSNVDRVMISKWETGYQTPRIFNIMCLAKIFNVSADYLSGEGKENCAPSKSIDEQLIELFSLLPDEDKSKVLIELSNKYLLSKEDK